MNTWDEGKRATNLAKHGVDFADLDRFGWSEALVEIDCRKDYRETRKVAIGPIGLRLHVVVFTERDGARRIVSARKANTREIKRYEREMDSSDT